MLATRGQGVGDVLPPGCSHIEMKDVCEPHPTTGETHCYVMSSPVCDGPRNTLSLAIDNLGIPLPLLVVGGLLVVSMILGGGSK